MPERICGANTVADKRYYHFVALTGRGMSLATYWRRLAMMGEVERPKVAVPVESSRFVLEHRKLRLGRAYARGAVTQTLSEQGNGRPPFLYDLFAAGIEFGDDFYLILGFPFAALAFETVDHLSDQGFLKNVVFQGADLSELLSEKNRPLQRVDGLKSSVVGVQFVVTDDKSLTALRLGGDDPFQAEIYKLFLREKFEKKKLWVPDQCVLACEREVEATQWGRLKPLGPILRSRLHIDKSGHFKFYMHAGCTNVTLMPYAIAQIYATACLKGVTGNPLRRSDQDDGG